MNAMTIVKQNLLDVEITIASVFIPINVPLNNKISMERRPSQYKDLDYEFFTNLEHYSPCFCYSQGTPLILVHKKCWGSFCCILFCIILYIFLVWLFHNYHMLSDHDSREHEPLDTILGLLNVFILIGMTVTFIGTQFLNPGIVNPQTISAQLFEEVGIKYCHYCQENVLDDMSHCKYCNVCIRDKDHHCSFFEKCMGGKLQNCCFKSFLIFSFSAFVAVFITMFSYLL